MQCFNPILLTHLATAERPEGFEVPCGKCMACRIARARQWALRLLHEMDSWDKAVFITLTYDDKNLPKGEEFKFKVEDRVGTAQYPTLVKRDLQLFFKRLRKNLKKRPIKYYACGEYGENNGRPHYHAIVFGLSTFDKTLIDESWAKGLVHIGTVTYDSCRYVAQYIDKKYDGELGRKVYGSKNISKPFQLVSQGMGLRFAVKYQDELKENLHTTVKGVIVSLPRYYKLKLDVDANALKALSDKRRIEGESRLLDKGLVYMSDEWGKYVVDAHEQSVATLKAKTKLFSKRHSGL